MLICIFCFKQVLKLHVATSVASQLFDRQESSRRKRNSEYRIFLKMARRLRVLVLGLLPRSMGLQQALRILPAFASHQPILLGSFVTITGKSFAEALKSPW